MLFPSSSLVLIRPTKGKLGYQILMARRSSVGSFSSAYVFPGGNLASSDKDPFWLSSFSSVLKDKKLENFIPYKIAALRETFEETGVFCGLDENIISKENKEALRQEAIKDDSQFLEYFKKNNICLKLNEVKYISEWLTPKGYPKRFSTKFFLGLLDQEHNSEDTSDNKEITHTTWVEPSEILEKYLNSEEIIFFPPQFYILSALKEYFKNFSELKKWHSSIPIIDKEIREFQVTDDNNQHISYTTSWVTPYLPKNIHISNVTSEDGTKEYVKKIYSLPGDKPSEEHNFISFIKSVKSQAPARIFLHRASLNKDNSKVFNPFSTPCFLKNIL